MDELILDATDWQCPVRVILNGRDLLEILQEYEVPHATAEGHPDLAGSYVGTAPYRLHRRLTSPTSPVSFLDCDGCGCNGCWPLRFSISSDEGTVTWNNFHQPFRRNWTYDLRFTFAREQYEAQLELLTRFRSPWELPPARFSGWPGDQLVTFPDAFYVDEPERPLSSYIALAAGRDCRRIVRDPAVPAVLRAAALKPSPREPAVPELLDSTDEWARLLVLLKLRESPVTKAVPRLLEMLNDPAELWDGIDDYVLIYRLADMAALALAASRLTARQQSELHAWLQLRRERLHDEDYTERRTAAFLFARLGEPAALEVLRALPDPPDDAVLDLLATGDSR